MKNLKEELKNTLNAFIIKCTITNLSIPVQGTAPVAQKMNVQELMHNTTDATLASFFTFLKKVPANVGSELLGEEQTYYVGEVTAEELAHFVDILRLIRKLRAEERKNKDAIDKLTTELNGLKTPEERKEDIKKQLAALQGS